MTSTSAELQDVWVLIFVAIGWAAVISQRLYLKVRQRGLKFAENSAGILVRRRTLNALPIVAGRRSLNAAAAGMPQLIEADVRLKFCPFLFSEDGVPHTRTFDSFCLRVPPPSLANVDKDNLSSDKRSFQKMYRTSTRMAIYSSLLRGALPNSSVFVGILCLFAMTLSWMQRNDLRLIWDDGLASPDTMEGNMLAASTIQKTLLPLVSFLLALYMQQKIGWYFGVISNAWMIQGKLHNIALELGSVLVPHDDGGHMRTKFVVYRYLNLIHFLTYKDIAAGYEDIQLEHLVACGLVTENETPLLDLTKSPKNIVILWLSSLIERMAQDGQINDGTRRELKEMVRLLRGDIDGLSKEMTRMTPISFAQLLQLMVDIVLLLTPPSLAYNLKTSREGVTVYLWPAFGTAITGLFYQGGMRIISAMEYPFGHELDHFRTHWLLMASESQIFNYLTGVPPDCYDVIKGAGWAPPGAQAGAQVDVKEPSMSPPSMPSGFDPVLPGSVS